MSRAPATMSSSVSPSIQSMATFPSSSIITFILIIPPTIDKTYLILPPTTPTTDNPFTDQSSKPCKHGNHLNLMRRIFSFGSHKWNSFYFVTINLDSSKEPYCVYQGPFRTHLEPPLLILITSHGSNQINVPAPGSSRSSDKQRVVASTCRRLHRSIRIQ